MKVVLAIDKFKGCATSRQLADAARQAINDFDGGIETVAIAVADGGDGTVEALTPLLSDVKIVETTVSAPVASLPDVSVKYALSGNTAVMDVASACGLALVPQDRRNVMLASSRGCGQLIVDAYRRGVKRVILGLGGSATCDCGMGLLSAIGFEFTDAAGRLLPPCGNSLAAVRHIGRTAQARLLAEEMKFTLLSDVTNPLLGHDGAARVFAPQKGASQSEVEALEASMTNFASLLPRTVATMPGAGAAGGICAGMAAFLRVTVKSGIGEILRLAGFERALRNASLIITGEGRIDSQTAMGKAPGVILSCGKKLGIPVVAICGQCEPDAACSLGFDSVVAVSPPDMPVATAMQTEVALLNVRRAVVGIISRFCRN